MNIIKPLPTEVVAVAEDFICGLEEDTTRYVRALELAKVADEMMQKVGVVIPTVEEVIDDLLGGPKPAKFETRPSGVYVQDGHTTAGFEMSRFHRGLLYQPGKVIGYSSDWSRFGTTMEMIDASGPLRITNFWGLFRTRKEDGSDVATPLLGLMERVEGNSYSEAQRTGTEGVRKQWGLKLSDDYKSPGYFMAITDWKAE